ncbi:MAG: ATP-binding cassette domain-containing protein, partial [Candidatus Firestonebacteria bacterium]|nr:ATP-binding cassette domain-containing protein [Candidatus Firestonebacteria bacterium]
MNAIEVRNLTKIYAKSVKAVDGIEFNVGEGEIFGFLGPNGAGKSTTIMLLTTLLRLTAGEARVAGFDVTRQPFQVRQAIGYVSQDLAVDDNLTGYENLFLQAKFYGLSQAQLQTRIPEVLGLVNLQERVHDLVETYSGGMRKRLDIAEGLVHRPRVLFLDEPTLGLDIQTRSEIWKYVTRLRDEFNMTIFLTTHYMDEADRLCDRIAIIDRGVIKAIDTPASLKREIGGDLVTLSLEGKESVVAKALAVLANLSGVYQIKPQDNQFLVIVENGGAVVPRIFEALHSQ